MLHSTPHYSARHHSAQPAPAGRMQVYHRWRPLLCAGVVALALLLAWQVSTPGALLAADASAANAIVPNAEWRFVDESKPGAPMTVGTLTAAGDDAPATVAARFDISSTMQALALQLNDADLGGLALADVEDLRYCTRLVDGPRPYAVTLQVNADVDVTDDDHSWQGRLVYTPAYNGAVIQGEWQCWDPLVGKWWATSGELAAVAPADNPLPLGTLLARFPQLGINATYSGLALKAGDGWRDFLGEASPVVINLASKEIDVAFGNAPHSNEVLLPVVFNEPPAGNNGNRPDKAKPEKADKEDKAKNEHKENEHRENNEHKENKDARPQERRPKWDGTDWANFDWEHFDWESFDWDKVDWEHLDWAVWGWTGLRADDVRAFIEDVKGCKKHGWEEDGFRNQGQCVAYYAAAHNPANLEWGWGHTWQRYDGYRSDEHHDDRDHRDHDSDHAGDHNGDQDD